VVSYDVVKEEAAAVRELVAAITRYAEHLRTVADRVRADTRQQRQLAEQEAEQRRATMERARQTLEQARAALSRCREGCGGLQQQVNQAAQQFKAAEERYKAARRAVGIIAGAETELLHSLRAAEGVIAAHAPVSVKALTELEKRIREYDSRRFAPPERHAGALQTAAVAFGLMRVLTGQGQGIEAARYTPPAPEPISIVLQDADQDRIREWQQQWGETDLDSRREANEELGRRPDGS
jgi:DNA repair exonuclease SbcCD ATPase subunit